jgi:methylated-DNA-[protein]-cysteine S-methyltransferase
MASVVEVLVLSFMKTTSIRRFAMKSSKRIESKQVEHATARVNRGAHKRYVYKWMNSPVGKLRLVASGDGLAAILWENDCPRRVRLNLEAEDKNHSVLLQAERQLTEYFGGSRKEFTLKLDFGGTAFQRSVWSALLTIPFGETRSYREIADQIGNPKATRAVGAANGRNPISIVAPCHRVIGSTGKLTGFAGGLTAKAYLLAMEAAKIPANAPVDRPGIEKTQR